MLDSFLRFIDANLLCRVWVSYLELVECFSLSNLADPEDGGGSAVVYFKRSAYPKSLGGLYDPGPGVSLLTSFKRVAVPNLLTCGF